MRLGFLSGLVVLACGGGTAATGLRGEPEDGGAGGTGGSASPTAGATSKLMGGGSSSGGAAAQHGGAAATGGAAAAGTPGAAGAAAATGGGTGGSSSGASGSGGVASAGASNGGSSGAAAGDAGAGGEGGAPPAPDDTGCISRPPTSNINPQLIPGLDCSSCTNGQTFGYTAPDFCEASKTCGAAVAASSLPADSFLLLPPGSAQKAPCREQACAAPPGSPLPNINLEGYVLQLMIRGDVSLKIETDDNRRVLVRDAPLIACSDVATCLRLNTGQQFAIVVKPGAPRGWARIRTGARTGESGPCQ